MAATKNSVSPTASEKPAIEPVTVSETMPVATTPAPSASSERRSDHSASPEGAASRSEPRTTSKAPSAIAKNAISSSVAFPNVALRSAPMAGLVCFYASSVAFEITHASGTSATAATVKRATEPTGRRRSATASGTTPNAAHISFRAMSAGVYPACNA